MSDTPETDAAELIYDGIVASGYADADVCRKLERECNQLKADWNKACDEQEAMTAKSVGWQNQAELNARLLVECREKAERYRLEANAMMAQRDEAREALALATSELAEQTFKLRQQLGKAREALQKVASLAHGSADKTVCLIHLNAIQRIAVAALKHEETTK